MSVAPAAASTTAAPNCGTQHNLDNPTGSSNQVLDGYWFSIDHNGKTITACTLFGNVDPGDVVTAHVDIHKDAKVEVTLASYSANAGDPQHQTLFKCDSFSNDSGNGDDPCNAADDTDLTVTVPDCGFQIDLIYGEPLVNLVMGHYANVDVWINGQAGDLGTACPAAPTPTPTPVPGQPTPSPTPTVSVQAASTPSTGGGDPALIATLGSLLLMGAGGSAVYASRRLGRKPPK